MQIHVGEGVHGGAQPPHRRRGVDAVPDHVADDQGDPGARQRDHVEPVAADSVPHVRREVARCHLQGRPAVERVGEQAALQGEGRGVLAGVAAGVVHVHRGPGHELLGEEEIVGVEGGRVQRPGEGGQTEDDTARSQRHGHE